MAALPERERAGGHLEPRRTHSPTSNGRAFEVSDRQVILTQIKIENIMWQKLLLFLAQATWLKRQVAKLAAWIGALLTGYLISKVDASTAAAAGTGLAAVVIAGWEIVQSAIAATARLNSTLESTDGPVGEGTQLPNTDGSPTPPRAKIVPLILLGFLLLSLPACAGETIPVNRYDVRIVERTRRQIEPTPGTFVLLTDGTLYQIHQGETWAALYTEVADIPDRSSP